MREAAARGLDLDLKPVVPPPAVETRETEPAAAATPPRNEPVAAGEPAEMREPELAGVASGSGVAMESDGRTRERLRFLMWMRRVQAEAARADQPAAR
jgi:hypothetical protein